MRRRVASQPVGCGGLQFHPEVYHTPEGKLLLESFARDICQRQPDWNLRDELKA